MREESCTEVSGKIVWSTPKTHQSRSVPVAGRLAERIAHVVRTKGPEDLIFTAPGGGVLRLGNWRARVFEPACREAGLDGVSPHDLRHTAASLAKIRRVVSDATSEGIRPIRVTVAIAALWVSRLGAVKGGVTDDTPSDAM